MNTKIHGVDFGPIWGMSGVQNFFGEGYWYHSVLKAMFGMSLEGITFVAKTTTFEARLGKMPLNKRLQPREWYPRCIYVNPFKGIALNAVGLSGPGLTSLLSRGIWQNLNSPFFISFMPVADTPAGKLGETRAFVRQMRYNFSSFDRPFGTQLNLSCPNVMSDPEAAVEDAHRHLDEFDWLSEKGMATGIKVSADMPVEKVIEIGKHPNCHAICVSNTIPFGNLPEEIPWKRLFPNGSPLLKRKGVELPGGLSGAPLQKIVVKWVREARARGFKKHINAGGGILNAHNLLDLYYAGADSFSIGSIVMLRPWNVNSVIRKAHELHKGHAAHAATLP